jgi:hypothetical protein
MGYSYLPHAYQLSNSHAGQFVINLGGDIGIGATVFVEGKGMVRAPHSPLHWR